MSYTKVKNDLLRSGELKANTKILLLVLISYENEKEGYSYPSQSRLLKETSLSKATLLKCLNELEGKGYIKRVKEKGENNKYYIASSIKIDTDTSAKNSTTTSAKNDTATSTKISTLKELNKNIKKEKEKSSIDKIIEAYTDNDLLVEALKDFMKMRKAIKRPLTDRAMKGILNKLDNYASDDLEKIEVLENSIVNCWQGIFPIKEKTPTAIGGQRKNNFNSSICNPKKNYARGVEML